MTCDWQGGPAAAHSLRSTKRTAEAESDDDGDWDRSSSAKRRRRRIIATNTHRVCVINCPSVCVIDVCLFISLSVFLSIFMAIFPGEPGLAGTKLSPFWILLGLRMIDGGDGDNWSYKMCKAPVKSSPPTFNILQARCPTCRPTNSVIALTGKISHFMDLLTPGLTNSSWLPCLSSAVWYQYPNLSVCFYLLFLIAAAWSFSCIGLMFHSTESVGTLYCKCINTVLNELLL